MEGSAFAAIRRVANCTSPQRHARCRLVMPNGGIPGAGAGSELSMSPVQKGCHTKRMSMVAGYQ
jgi:hypothetical protein